MSGLLASGPGGWRLEEDKGRFTLRGLAVTRWEAQQVLFRRGRPLAWARVPAGDGWVLTMLELEAAEARAIEAGAAPLDVLAPMLYARALGLREMTGS